MLRWFVRPHIAETAILRGVLLTENDVHPDPSAVSSACLELHRIKHYFTTTGWLSVLRIVKRVEELGWICKVCQEGLDGESIGCDGCLEWYHYHCVAIARAPKAKKWFCQIKAAIVTCIE